MLDAGTDRSKRAAGRVIGVKSVSPLDVSGEARKLPRRFGRAERCLSGRKGRFAKPL